MQFLNLWNTGGAPEWTLTQKNKQETKKPQKPKTTFHSPAIVAEIPIIRELLLWIRCTLSLKVVLEHARLACYL